MSKNINDTNDDFITQEYDTVVIGGGLAGLTAAILLAEGGQSVIVFERSAALGGRAQTRERDGYRLNLGPHALYRGNAGMRILKSMGIELTGKNPKYGKQPLALTASESGLLPATPMGMLSSKLFAGRRLALMRSMIALMRAKPEKLENVTWRDWLDQTIRDERVRDLIEMLGRISTYANAPELMSAGATLKQSKSAFLSNVLYMDGGWAQMVNKLIDRANSLGVTIRTGTSVKDVNQVDGGVSVTLAGIEEPLLAIDAIVAVPPQAASKLMPQSSELAEAITKIRPVQAACLTLGLRRLPKPETLIAQGLGLPLYASVHSASAHLTPSGEALIHTALYIVPNDERTPEEHRTVLEDLLDRVQPGWRDEVTISEYLPRMTVVHAYVEAAQSRPSIAAANLPNVYVIGDWVDSGEMLADGSFASAEMAAHQILSV